MLIACCGCFPAARPRVAPVDVRRLAWCCSEDCPTRAFVSWSYRSVTLKSEIVDLEGEDPVSTSYDVYSKLVRLGQQLTEADLTHADISAALDNLRQRYSEFLPSNDRIKKLCEMEGLTTLEEYLDLFDAPFDVPLESELVWPAPKSLVY